MPLYFLPTGRQIAKFVSFRPNTKKWSNKYVTIHHHTGNKYKIKSNQCVENAQQQSQQTKDKLSSSSSLASTTTRKGKLRKLVFHFKWSWKAGAGWTILSVLDWWLLVAGGWFTWSGLMRWTPIGVCMFAAIEWHLHNRQLEKQGLPKVASQLQMNIYCLLPLRLMSRCWGWLADCRIPINLRPYVYSAYINLFNVNLDEAANTELKDYRSIGEFFTRTLRDGVRKIDYESCLVSPADGYVLHFGTTNNKKVEQVKGITYSLESFIGPISWTTRQKQNLPYHQKIKYNSDEETLLYQCVIYLAPGDYHRFHSPAEWEPLIRRHFTGELLSVNPRIAQWLPGLFCLNERALYVGKWKYGFFSFTAVGATNVGSVQIYFDEKLKTNKWNGLNIGNLNINEYDEISLTKQLELNKGDILGQFNMGSTIVLIFEAPKKFRFSVAAGQKIRVGEKLGCLSD